MVPGPGDDLDVGNDDIDLIKAAQRTDLPKVSVGKTGGGGGRPGGGRGFDPAHYQEANTGRPLFKSEQDTILTVNGIATYGGGEQVKTIGRPGYEDTSAELETAQAALQAAQQSGDQDEIARLTREIGSLESAQMRQAQPNDEGLGKAVTITDYPPSTKQGLAAIRMFTMPDYSAEGTAVEREPVNVSIRRANGKVEYVKARYVGPAAKRSMTWDDDVVLMTDMLKNAGDMYKRAAFANMPAIELGRNDTLVTKQFMAFGHPYFKEVKGDPDIIMGMGPEEKLAALTHTDQTTGQTTAGPAAAELLKRDADKVFTQIARDYANQLRSRAEDETAPQHAQERAVEALERLMGIVKLDPAAMAAPVHTNSTFKRLQAQAREMEKRAHASTSPTNWLSRARELRAQAERMFNPAADKFEALIALIAYANLSRMGHGIGRYEKKPHPSTASLRQVQADPGKYFAKHGPEDQPSPKVQSRPISKGKTIMPPKSAPPGVPESRVRWVERMFFHVLESRGAREAYNFLDYAHRDPKTVLPVLKEGQVILFGFKKHESFLNGLSGKIVESTDTGVIVTLNNTPRVQKLLAPNDRTLRVVPEELIVVGGTLKG